MIRCEPLIADFPPVPGRGDMDLEQGRLSVWVCREEKLVSGITRRTTCRDVVRVLLEDAHLQRTGILYGPPDLYRVVEKWRGSERTLPDDTHILQLWSAWGAQRHDVCFVLVRNDASLPNSSPRTAEARVVPSREGFTAGASLQGGGVTLSQDRQRRVVRKAFRKLAKMNRKRDKTRGSVERMETLVHLVISQDHTIRQQVWRIRELDREVDRYEAVVHRDRVRLHGANYLQDTYLVEGSNSGERRDVPGLVALRSEQHGARCAVQEAQSAQYASRFPLAQLKDYARCCQELVLLQEELTRREELIERITIEIQEELNHRWMRRQAEELGTEADQLLVLEEEEEVIRTQLDASLDVGQRLKVDLDIVRGDLDRSLALWESREHELLDLLALVGTMELEVDEAWVEHARGLPGANDEDSDTGMSSMNSQDSDSTPVCESLV